MRLTRFFMVQFLEVATSIGDRVSGPHVVHIDPRRHQRVDLLVAAALRMHHLFREKGVPQESIIVSVCIEHSRYLLSIYTGIRSHSLCLVMIDSCYRGRHPCRPNFGTSGHSNKLVSCDEFGACRSMRGDKDRRCIGYCRSRESPN